MKSQITRVTAATLLSVNEGASVLASLIPPDAATVRKCNNTVTADTLRRELFSLPSYENLSQVSD